MEDEYIHVACPCCKNKRLFDLLRGSKGIVSIKCPICKAVVAVSLHDGRASSKKNYRRESYRANRSIGFYSYQRLTKICL